MYRTIAFFDAPMTAPKWFLQGGCCVGGNEIDRIGKTLLEVAKMEGLGLSGKGCAEVGTVQIEGQEHVCLRAWDGR